MRCDRKHGPPCEKLLDYAGVIYARVKFSTPWEKLVGALHTCGPIPLSTQIAPASKRKAHIILVPGWMIPRTDIVAQAFHNGEFPIMLGRPDSPGHFRIDLGRSETWRAAITCT